MTDLSWPKGGSFFSNSYFRINFSSRYQCGSLFTKARKNTVMGESVLVFNGKAAYGNSTCYYVPILQEKQEHRKGVVPKKMKVESERIKMGTD